MIIIIDPYRFTKCKDCVHYDHDGRNVNYMGNCEGCVHNEDRADYFYHKIYDRKSEKK
jgi:hypothetical protein